MSEFQKYYDELYGFLPNELEQKAQYDAYMAAHSTDDKFDFISNVFLPERFIDKMEINVFPHFRFSPPNYHTQSFLMINFVCRGEFVNTIEGEEVIMHAGDVCITGPYTYRSFDCTSKDFDERCFATTFHIFVHPNSIEKMFENVLKKDDAFSNFIKSIILETQHSNYALFTCKDNSVSLRLGELLWFEMRSSRDVNSVANSDIGNAIFKAFLAEITNEKRYSLSFSKKNNRASTNDIITYITNHFRTITLQELSRHFNYSLPYISKLIKQRLGKNFTEFITELRIQNALKLLKNSSLTITAISQDCGYKNIEHFLRVFKSQFGITPTEYRNQNKPQK